MRINKNKIEKPKKRDTNTYLDELFQNYQSIKGTYLGGSLVDLTENRIKNALLSRINNLSEEDQLIFDNFIQLSRKKPKFSIIYKTNENGSLIDYYSTINEYSPTDGLFKPIINFLKSGTKTKIRNIDTTNLLAYIIDYQPRPFTKYLQHDSKEKKKEEIAEKKTIQRDVIIKFLKILGIIALLLYIITTLFTNFFKKEKTTGPITINIENFNTNHSYYYYYTKDGKVTLLDDAASLHFKEKNSKPITRKVLNTYFFQQGKDTTSKKYKTLQAQYFNKGNIPIIDTENNDLKQTILVKQNDISKQQANNKSEKTTTINKVKIDIKTTNSLSFNIQHNGAVDYEMLSLFQNIYQNKYQISTQTNQEEKFTCNGNTNYHFRQSKKDENRVICDFVLTYQISIIKTKKIIKSKNKKVIGTGFSEQAAKENAINKMGLLLK